MPRPVLRPRPIHVPAPDIVARRVVKTLRSGAASDVSMADAMTAVLHLHGVCRDQAKVIGDLQDQLYADKKPRRQR